MDLRGRSAIVTGGAGGLGSAVVQRWARSGTGVVVLDRSERRAGQLAERLGGAVRVVGGDANTDADVERAIDAATELGPLGALVNVAGGGVGGGPTVRCDREPHDQREFVETMTMNVFGAFNASRLVAAAMAGNEPDAHGQRGVVVQTASIAAYEGQRGQVAYAAAKAALVGMVLPMARDLADHGIRVCAVAPGPMGTPVMRRVMGELEVDPAEGIVFPRRLGEPEEFAQLVASVVANPYLNGECIRIDGALRLAGG